MQRLNERVEILVVYTHLAAKVVLDGDDVAFDEFESHALLGHDSPRNGNVDFGFFPIRIYLNWGNLEGYVYPNETAEGSGRPGKVAPSATALPITVISAEAYVWDAEQWEEGAEGHTRSWRGKR